MGLAPVDMGLGHPVQDFPLQLIPKILHPRIFIFHVRQCQSAGFSQADNAGGIFRTAPPPHLLVTADDERGKRNPFPDIENPHALGSMELMTGQGQHVDMAVFHIDGDFTRNLNCV